MLSARSHGGEAKKTDSQLDQLRHAFTNFASPVTGMMYAGNGGARLLDKNKMVQLVMGVSAHDSEHDMPRNHQYA